MRLNEQEIKAIKACAELVFGESVKVFLFGSRIDDEKRGGDIDLYVMADEGKATYKNKISFLVELRKSIGEQKIDVVIAKDKNRPIEQAALNSGIAL